MAASTSVSRSIRRTLSTFFYTTHRHYSSSTTNPTTHLFHGKTLPNILQPHRFNPTSQLVACRTLVTNPNSSMFTYYRYLSVSPQEPNLEKGGDVKPETEDPKAKAEDVKAKTEDSSKNQTGSEEGKAVRGSPVSWMSFVLLCLTGAGLIFYFDKKKKEYIEAMNENANKNSTAKVEPSVGKAAIGGPFSLVNHEGKSVTEKDFKGKWTLIYFGFTHCPDICPDELQKLAAALDKIKEKGIEVVPLFISVDPERDTVEQIRDYVKEFHPDLVGLTGSPDDIKSVARAYRVYYMKTDDGDSDYLVDHSIVMYLMDPDMEFVKFFGKNEVVDTLAAGIIKEIEQYKK